MRILLYYCPNDFVSDALNRIEVEIDNCVCESAILTYIDDPFQYISPDFEAFVRRDSELHTNKVSCSTYFKTYLIPFAAFTVATIEEIPAAIRNLLPELFI